MLAIMVHAIVAHQYNPWDVHAKTTPLYFAAPFALLAGLSGIFFLMSNIAQLGSGI